MCCRAACGCSSESSWCMPCSAQRAIAYQRKGGLPAPVTGEPLAADNRIGDQDGRSALLAPASHSASSSSSALPVSLNVQSLGSTLLPSMGGGPLDPSSSLTNLPSHLVPPNAQASMLQVHVGGLWWETFVRVRAESKVRLHVQVHVCARARSNDVATQVARRGSWCMRFCEPTH